MTSKTVYDIIVSLLEDQSFTKKMSSIKSETGISSSNLSNKLRDNPNLFERSSMDDSELEKKVRLKVNEYINDALSSQGFSEVDSRLIFDHITNNRQSIAKIMRKLKEELMNDSFSRFMFRRDPLFCVMIKAPAMDSGIYEKLLTILLTKHLSGIIGQMLKCKRTSNMVDFIGDGGGLFVEMLVKSMIKRFQGQVQPDPKIVFDEVIQQTMGK